MEIGLTTNGRHAYAIAIAANARNDALHQMLHLRMVGPSETQRIHIGYGPRAHGEHVAQYTAHARRRALIGFNVRRVIMRFHFEDSGKLGAIWTVANVDDARIFARTADHPRGLSRQFLQMDTRGFVGAMLRPHHREYAKFDHVGHASHGEQDARIFF